MKGGITAIILTQDEEDNLPSCISRLSWVDKIAVVDSGSTDRTVEKAWQLGAQTVYCPWQGFAGQRNWALDNLGIETEWVIFVDADEHVTEALKREILETLSATDKNAFYLCFRVIFLGKWVKRSSGFPVWHPRIVRRNKVRFRKAVSGHGETWDVQGTVGYMSSPYTHYSFSKGLSFWFDKHNRLSDEEAEAVDSAEQTTVWGACRQLLSPDPHRRRQAARRISYELPFWPFMRFVYQFFLRGGILDGRAGWAYCSLYLAYEIMIATKLRERRARARRSG